MPTTFRPCEPDRLLPFAPDVRGRLPEGRLAHHVSGLVDEPDLTAFHTPYEGDGRRNAPYEPRMMVKVLPYGYAAGVRRARGRNHCQPVRPVAGPNRAGQRSCRAGQPDGHGFRQGRHGSPRVRALPHQGSGQ